MSICEHLLLQVILTLHDAPGVLFNIQIDGSAFRLDLLRGKHEQGQTQECGHPAGGHEVAFGVERTFGDWLRHLAKVMI
ncbi:hypothetical protein QKY98_23165 [Pseudomonas sp. HR1]|uniref:hypothetical protein n=1 Tax=Pseudomonas TaxID=286 RepID=UPI0002E85E63|nr:MULTISPECIES: hypothetical protein [Pseudomonas]MDK4202034.1 hypothetical protein [Pseudomonas sp. HR1]MDK8266743.1 hypothetical protein [Pseudomonas oryzihabitans]